MTTPWSADFPFRDPPAAALHYLDSASTSQIVRPALAAIQSYDLDARANVHRGVYARAEAATARYEAARRTVARFLNARPDEVVFTSGTTAAINLVAHSFGSLLEPGDEIIVSELDHHANLVPWQLLAERRGLVLKAIPLDPASGRLKLAALDGLLGPRTRLIAVTHASNVTGAVTDVATVVSAARSVGAAVLLDGAQMARHRVDVAALGVDFYAFSGHKLFGPTGIGVLWGRAERLAAMPPFLGGGEMIRRVTLQRSTFADPPTRFEAGTPPIGAAIGMGAACAWLMEQDLAAIDAHERRLTARLLDGLRRIQSARVIGPVDMEARVGVVSFDLDGAHPHDVAQILDGFGVAIRGGHHCAQPLHDAFDLGASNRASTAPYTVEADIDRCLEAVAEAARKLT